MTDAAQLHRICEDEPIHRPGAIQPHGALVLLDAEDRIAAASANLAAVLGAEPRRVLGARLQQVLGDEAWQVCAGALARHEAHPTVAGRDAIEFDGAHIEVGAVRHGAYAVLDFERWDPDADTGRLLHEATAGLSTLRLIEDPLDKAAACCRLIRRLTGFDRVMVYRLHQDDHGEVVAEDRAEPLETYLGLHYPASDIPPQARRLYLDHRTRMIPDVDYEPVPLLGPLQAASADIGRSDLRSVSPYHVAYLRNMGVRATLVGSLVSDDRLWGLVACHHVAGPRTCRPALRDVFEWICNDLAQQITLVERDRSTRYAGRLQTVRDALALAVRRGGLEALCASQAAESILATAGADGFALVRDGAVSLVGATPPADVVARLATDLRACPIADEPHGPIAVDALAERLPWAADIVDVAAGVLSLRLPGPSRRHLLWFRGERSRKVRWAGDPNRALVTGADGAPGPRRSFAEWLQEVRGRSEPWLALERASASGLVDALQAELGRQAKQRLPLTRQARTDALTGLGNRLALAEQAARWLVDGSHCALALMDLDGFKAVNDQHGHGVGDEALCQIARRLARIEAPDSAFVARVGGDELAVLLRLHETDAASAQKRAAAFLAAIREPVRASALMLDLYACAGLATYPENGRDFETLLRRADLALYRAKATGPDRLALFTDELERAFGEQALLQTRLGKALDLGQLELHYQPIVRLADRSLQGFEALCRWRQEDGSLLMPDCFIPHAESSGLIGRIDHWALQRAADTVRVLDTSGLRSKTISVNLSAMQLRRDSGLVGVLTMLKARQPGIERRLVLEITESAAIDDRGEALATIEASRGLGFRFSLDDFGAGYASLAYLHRLGATVLKIDRSFIRGLPEEAQAAKIVRAVVNLGHDLGLEVIAEGVETEAQAAALKTMGCDAFQGWLIGKAVPLSDAIRLASAANAFGAPADRLA